MLSIVIISRTVQNVNNLVASMLSDLRDIDHEILLAYNGDINDLSSLAFSQDIKLKRVYFQKYHFAKNCNMLAG